MQALRSTLYHDDYEMLPESEIKTSLKSKSCYSKFRWFAFVVSFLVLCIVFMNRSSFQSNSSYPLTRGNGWLELLARKVKLPHIYDGIQTENQVNSTLGFQQIIALNLPHRLDKKDELTLMGHASDIKVDFLTTRLVSDLKDIGLPHIGKIQYPGVIGCWRAHVDAWLRVVTEKITSALILEDDTDWDVDIKKQLQRAHQPLATLLESISDDDQERVSTSSDPWLHKDWDVLFLGYCREKPFDKNDHPDNIYPDFAPHVLYDDDTIPDRSYMLQSEKETEVGTMVNFMDHFGYPLPTNNTTTTKRVVLQSYNPVCMNAYAVSLKGAAKLLYLTSREIPYPVDVQMMGLIGTGQINAYEIMPPLMSQWKIKDANSKNSDNEISAVGDKYVEELGEANHNPSIGGSNYIRNSVRSSLHHILTTM